MATVRREASDDEESASDEEDFYSEDEDVAADAVTSEDSKVLPDVPDLVLAVQQDDNVSSIEVELAKNSESEIKPIELAGSSETVETAPEILPSESVAIPAPAHSPKQAELQQTTAIEDDSATRAVVSDVPLPIEAPQRNTPDAPKSRKPKSSAASGTRSGKQSVAHPSSSKAVIAPETLKITEGTGVLETGDNVEGDGEESGEGADAKKEEKKIEPYDVPSFGNSFFLHDDRYTSRRPDRRRDDRCGSSQSLPAFTFQVTRVHVADTSSRYQPHRKMLGELLEKHPGEAMEG